MAKPSKNKPQPAPERQSDSGNASDQRFQIDGNVIWGVAMLALGYSNAFADSSFALYLVGASMLAWGIFRTIVPPKPKPKEAKDNKKKGESAPATEGFRETVESLVVAFILAFLFKSFQAEAFVIPTGSMAPTLLGRHKDVECSQCGYQYTVGASQEIPNGRLIERQRLEFARCPNCRFQDNIYDSPPFPGDRIIVTKLHNEPGRFDVIVFKYPEEPHVNYIKRCVGLPNETVTIMRGDLYRRVAEGDEWEILRKPDPDKQQAIQLLVYDDSHFPQAIADSGWPNRWAGAKKGDTPTAIGGWQEDSEGFRRDETTGQYELAASDQQQWLRYRHIVAGGEDWEAILAGSPTQPVPRLISDFCGYNTTETVGEPRDRRLESYDHGPFWVGDLTIEFTANIASEASKGVLTVELVEGDNTYQANFDTESGDLSLTRTWEGSTSEIATAKTQLDGPGTYSIRFANVDNRLSVWVNDRVVELGEGALIKTGLEVPTNRDLSPVGIAATNLKIDISDIALFRDIYYRDEQFHSDRYDPRTGKSQPTENAFPEVSQEWHLRDLLRTPEDWYQAYMKGRNDRDNDYAAYQRQNGITTGNSGMAVFELGPDEYLMFGDNSERSQDSRLFPQGARIARREDFKRYAVQKSAIIGKAFFVYWPHGKPFLNEGKGYAFPGSYHVNERGEAVKEYPNHRIPFYPNVGRMRRIR